MNSLRHFASFHIAALSADLNFAGKKKKKPIKPCITPHPSVSLGLRKLSRILQFHFLSRNNQPLVRAITCLMTPMVPSPSIALEASQRRFEPVSSPKNTTNRRRDTEQRYFQHSSEQWTLDTLPVESKDFTTHYITSRQLAPWKLEKCPWKRFTTYNKILLNSDVVTKNYRLNKQISINKTHEYSPQNCVARNQNSIFRIIIIHCRYNENSLKYPFFSVNLVNNSKYRLNDKNSRSFVKNWKTSAKNWRKTGCF